MQHPEQALFDEVKALRTDMEQLRDRIFKIENDYNEKVEKTEKKEFTQKRIDQKIKDYNASLSERKDIIVDGKRVPLFKKTVESNVYKCPKLLALWDFTKTEVIMDIDFRYFTEILNILRRGHNLTLLNPTEAEAFKKSFRLQKEFEKDYVFHSLISNFFDQESTTRLSVEYNLPFVCLPKSLEDIVANMNSESGNCSTIGGSYNLFENKKYNDLFDSKSDNAIFLDYNSALVVELKDAVRVRNFALKPFTKDTNVFYPTTGSYYASVAVSEDGVNFTNSTLMPSDYGSTNNDYVTTFDLGGHKNVKFFKFSTTGSSQFSVSTIFLEYKPTQKK